MKTNVNKPLFPSLDHNNRRISRGISLCRHLGLRLKAVGAAKLREGVPRFDIEKLGNLIEDKVHAVVYCP